MVIIHSEADLIIPIIGRWPSYAPPTESSLDWSSPFRKEPSSKMASGPFEFYEEFKELFKELSFLIFRGLILNSGLTCIKSK